MESGVDEIPVVVLIVNEAGETLIVGAPVTWRVTFITCGLPRRAAPAFVPASEIDAV